jgi:RNA polymerase sigma-70 factor (ECF subfamily)
VTVDSPQGNRQDQQLAWSAAEGDERAWRKLYEMTYQPLFNFLCYQVGDRETAKDLLQETYVVALGKLRDYRGEGPLLGWLRTIALRRSLDWRRRLRQQLTLLQRLASETPVSPGDAADARLDVQSEAFQAALARLSPRQRAALILRELEEQTFQEIALALGCNEATARVHYHRARAGMRRWLDTETIEGVADEMGGQRA